MNNMLCTIVTGPSYQEAKKQMEIPSDLYELRLDYFDTLDLAQIASLLTKPAILTLRNREQERSEWLLKLSELRPAFIDLDTNVPRSVMEKIAAKTKIIISYHNFEETPDLEPLWEKLTQFPAAYYKIATMGTALDSLRMLQFVKTHKNCIGFCLGEAGSFSRILGPIFGSPITYAPNGEAIAPGQIPLNELVETYRIKTLTPATKIFGLLGFPLTNSLSPSYHNHKYRERGLDAVYVKMPSHGHELSKLISFGFSGLSVTMPLKEEILPYLDQIDPEAKEIGAVNTIVCQKGQTIGYNTDGKGALDALEEMIMVRGKNLMILGAGGAARAIIYEAKKRGARVFIFNRTFEKAKKLAKHFGVEALQEMKPYDIAVNCTPVDMPIDDILPNTVVMDIRSRPKLTPFLACAAQKNCTLVYGEGMFNYQAIEQWRLWGIGEGIPSPGVA
jgi:3-dehydroquinate dehydratase / shikimate dehydrogenase